MLLFHTHVFPTGVGLLTKLIHLHVCFLASKRNHTKYKCVITLGCKKAYMQVDEFGKETDTGGKYKHLYGIKRETGKYSIGATADEKNNITYLLCCFNRINSRGWARKVPGPRSHWLHPSSLNQPFVQSNRHLLAILLHFLVTALKHIVVMLFAKKTPGYRNLIFFIFLLYSRKSFSPFAEEEAWMHAPCPEQRQHHFAAMIKIF